MTRLLFAVMFCLLIAPAAHAATVTVVPADRYVGGSDVVFGAAAGEVNATTVTGLPNGTVLVTDSGAPLTPATGCTALNANAVSCAASVERRPLRGISVALGDGADSLRATTAPGRPWARVAVDGGRGNDTIDLSGVRTEPLDSFFAATVRGGPGRDLIRGTSGPDDLAGGSGRDELHGGPGDDALDGDGTGSVETRFDQPARDVLDGGRGIDTVSYAAHPRGVTVDLAAPKRAGARGENDRLSGIENVIGSAFADDLRGGPGPNDLEGHVNVPFARSARAGDRIVGRGGDDVISGTGRADILDGGPGADDIDLGGGRDRYACGAGNDIVEAGGTALTVVAGCEQLDDGAYTFRRLRANRAKNRILATVDADLPTVCAESLSLRAARGNGPLGSVKWSDPPPARLSIALNAAGRRLVRKGGQMVVRARNCSTRPRAWILTFAPPKPKPKR